MAISDVIARVTESGLVTLTKADPLTTMLYAITSLSVPLYLHLRLQEQQFCSHFGSRSETVPDLGSRAHVDPSIIFYFVRPIYIY